MNILTDKQENYKEIFVMGEFQSEDDINYLFTLLENRNSMGITVTFFEAKVIPSDYVERLALYMAGVKPGQLNIAVLHRYLHTYLLRLGIRNRLLVRKTIMDDVVPKIKVVAIGGSSGSLNKIYELIDNLPLAEISVFIIQHVKADAHNYLPKLLTERFKCIAVMPENCEKIEKGRIYIAPPGYHMKVIKGSVCLSNEELVNYARPSIEVSFKSLADEYEDRLCAVIVSGYGNDGINSLQYLKEKGSKVIIEDPDECEAGDLPRNALNTGMYDRKLTIPKIIAFLKENIPYSLPEDQDIDLFLQKVYIKYGYDYRDYEIESIRRRIKVAMIKANISDFKIFEIKVLDNSGIFEELFLELSINVTEFFRDHDTFQILREKVLPYLDSYTHIKIWCCGCSTGEEPYSLAILLEELGMLKKTLIYATDINPFVIEEAKNGLFSNDKILASQSNYIRSGGKSNFTKYFETKSGFAKINKTLRENILFFQHSLVGSGVLNEFQLILCRNVMIYFNDKMKDTVLKLFSDSLDMSGFLVLGKSEEIVTTDGKKNFNKYDKKNKIYKKTLF